MAIGSSTTPVYIDDDGIAKACTGISTSSWKIVSKSSGDTLDTLAYNDVAMNGNVTLKLPASTSDSAANTFALVVTIQTKGTLTIKNNDGTAFNVYTYGSSFSTTGSTTVVDPFAAFDAMTAGQMAIFLFEEIANTSGKYKVSVNKLTVHDGSGVTYHTVTFVSNGGTSVDSEQVAHGGTVSRPTNPTRTDYNFVNWYTEPEFTTVYDFSSAVNADVTLYAKWQTTQTVTVTFNSNGGTDVASQTIAKGSKLTVPSTPTKTNYTFDGWYTDSGLTAVADLSTKTFDSDTTLYAKWKITNEVTVTFIKDGVVYNTQTIPKDTTVTMPTEPTKEKYDFSGWYSAANGGTVVDLTQPITTDTTVYAVYTIQAAYKVTVTFMSNDTDVYDTIDGVKGETLSGFGSASKTGYAFVGWYEKEDGAYTTEFTASTVLTDNLTVYAKFSDIADWANILDSVMELKVGDELVAPSAGGFAPIVLKVVDVMDGHVSITGKSHHVTFNTKWLLSDTDGHRIDTIFQTDTSLSNSNCYKDSTIRNWLTTETAPTELRGNFAGSFLVNDDLSPKTDLTQTNAFLNALSVVNVPHKCNSHSTEEKLQDKFWLPSYTELGGTDDSQSAEGHALTGIDTEEERPRSGVSSFATVYWSRSAYKHTTTAVTGRVWVVSASGDLSDNDAGVSGGASPLMSIGYNTCTVTYKYNDDGATADTTQTRVVGGTAVKINPSRDGYHFYKWYKDSACTEEYDFTTKLTGDLTLYGSWVTTDWANIGTELDSMNLGDVIQAPSASGLSAISFGLVHKQVLEIADASGNNRIAYLMATEALKETSGLYVTMVYGSDNNYNTSTIHTYLKDTLPGLFTTGKSGEELKTAEAFLNVISDRRVPYSPYDGSKSTTSEASKFWAPSVEELGLTSGNFMKDGTTAFDAFASRTTTSSDSSSMEEYQKRARGIYYWSRSASSNLDDGAWGVNGSGSLSNVGVNYSYGVVPLIMIPYRVDT